MKINLFPIIFLCLILIIEGCANTSNKTSQLISIPNETKKNIRLSQTELENKILKEFQTFGEADIFKKGLFYGPDGKLFYFYDIPFSINRDIEQAIDLFENKISKRFKLYLARSTRYESIMRNIIKHYKLPEDLVYIALVESGFSCQAVSKASAVGPWQFIKGTAIRYGLKIDSWVDERQDPIKSTHAAAKYLRDLFVEFGSWYLAIAAYNAGENKIRRALNINHGNDYWSISRHPNSILTDETKEYIPRIIAAAIISKEPIRYGFTDINYVLPMTFEEVSIYPNTPLNTTSKISKLNIIDLITLNPELKRGITPPFGGIYNLRVPIGYKNHFENIHLQISSEDKKKIIDTENNSFKKNNNYLKINKKFSNKFSNLSSIIYRYSSSYIKPSFTFLTPDTKNKKNIKK